MKAELMRYIARLLFFYIDEKAASALNGAQVDLLVRKLSLVECA